MIWAAAGKNKSDGSSNAGTKVERWAKTSFGKKHEVTFPHMSALYCPTDFQKPYKNKF